MMTQWSFYLVLLLFGSTGYALVEHTIDEKSSLDIALSKTSHNRISVEQGGVERIFASEAYFNINIDRATGNAFVTVTRDILTPVILTVITSSGFIQDIAVTSEDKLSEHLILKEEADPETLVEQWGNFHEHTVAFLNKIMEGHIPLGYGSTKTEEQDLLVLPKPLISSAIKVFEGPYDRIVVYSIKNSGKEPVVISADALKNASATWAFLNAHELRSKEQVLCIMSYPKI